MHRTALYEGEDWSPRGKLTGNKSQLGAFEVFGVSSLYYRGFGGGCGFGTPVVSYAPRPILNAVDSRVIIENFEAGLDG